MFLLVVVVHVGGKTARTENERVSPHAHFTTMDKTWEEDLQGALGQQQ